MLDRLRVQSAQQNVVLQPYKIKPQIDRSQFLTYSPRNVGPVIKQAPRQVAQPISKSIPKPQLKQQVVHHTPVPKVYAQCALPKIVTVPPRAPTPRQVPQKQMPVVVKSNYPHGRSSPKPVNALRNMGSNRVLIMIAAGPSINEVSFQKIKDLPDVDFMCINQPNKEVWPSKFWAFCDQSQFERNKQIWADYNGIIINSTNVRERKGNQYVLNGKPGLGFATDVSGGYHIGRSSTYANMQIAYYMNYEKIFIFGLDMAADSSGNTHYYGVNPHVSKNDRIKRFAAEAESYNWAGKNTSKEVRDRFVLCSSLLKWPFVDYFTRIDHKVAVDHILDYMKTRNNL